MEEEKRKEMIKEKINDKERKKINVSLAYVWKQGGEWKREKKKQQQIVHFLSVWFGKKKKGNFQKKYFFTFIPSLSGEESKRLICKIIILKAIKSQEMWLIS